MNPGDSYRIFLAGYDAAQTAANLGLQELTPPTPRDQYLALCDQITLDNHLTGGMMLTATQDRAPSREVGTVGGTDPALVALYSHLTDGSTMIQAFIDNFIANESAIRESFKADPPASYSAIIETVVKNISPCEYDDPDPRGIHEINDGDYQGTLLYIIPAVGYQPHDYWFVKVYYGSCSGCDTLEAILDCTPEDAVDDYWTLALHVAQGLKEMQ